jgi:Putative transposase/Transposase zinc-binding domain
MSAIRRRRAILCRLVEDARPFWDHAGVRSHVRATLSKMLLCGTPGLGAEVFSSIGGETRTVYHTCKTRVCPSCGFFQALRFQHEMVNYLPAIPYRGLILTIPSRLREVLRLNRQLLPDLAALGGGAMSDLARERCHAEVPLIVVLHTFNPELKFKPHLHAVVGLTGLDLSGDRLVKNIFFSKDMLQERWRYAILDRLEEELRPGRLRLPPDLSRERLLKDVDDEYGLLWRIEEHRCTNKHQLLSYVARYIGRPPISNSRILEFNAHCVRFRYRDKLDYDRVHEATISTQEFIDRLIEHIREPYQHGVRYFGLLSPQGKSIRYPAYLRMLGEPPPGPVRPLRWADARYLSFGSDPLIDKWGNPMVWSYRLPPQFPAN